MGSRKRAQATNIKKKQARKTPQAGKKQAPPKPKAKKPAAMAEKKRELAPGEFLDRRDESDIPEGFDPRAIFSPLQFLQSQPPENASLEEQVAFLNDRQAAMAEYIAYLMNEHDYMKSAEDWVRTFPGGWPDEWLFIQHFARQFASNWGYMDSAEKKLTKRQKKQLIASLEGYCVQEDFDSIVSRLSPDHKSHILYDFAAIFLTKTAVEKFFQHPFWYVEALPTPVEEECEGLPGQDVSPDGAVLERFLVNFEKVNPKYARIWRNVTARLCNSMYGEHAEDTSFGKAMHARRQARCRELAKRLLEDKAFQCLLKPTDEIDRREQALADALAGMADVIVPMLSQDPTLKFRMLHELEPRFHHAHKSMEADFHHYLDPDEPEPRLDGHRVLIIQYPFVVRIWSDGEGGETTVCKASAIMEDSMDGKE